MINTPNSRVSNMAKDFGVKSKTILDILEAKGYADKKNTSVLTPDEYGVVVEAMTRDNQITNMTQYLAGEVDIPRNAPKADAAKADAAKTAAPKTEAPKADAAKAAAPKTEAPKTEAPKAEAPKTEAPKTEAPKTEAPKAEAPKAEAPKAEAPKAEAPKAEAPKAEAPKAEAPKAEAPKADAPKPAAPKQPVQFRPNTNQRPANAPQGGQNANGQRPAFNNNNGQRPAYNGQGQQGQQGQSRPPYNGGQNGPQRNGAPAQGGQQGQRPACKNKNGPRPCSGGNGQQGQGGQSRPAFGGNNNGGNRFGGNGGGFQQRNDRPQRDNRGFGRGGDDDRDPKEGRPSFRPAAPKIAQPQATSYSKPTATGGSTRVVDTRGAGNVDLSKYDEKLDTLVPDAAKDMNGAKQKLKKQNNRPQFDKKKKGDKERDAMEKMRREAAEKAKKQPLNVTIPEELQVNELAALLHVTNAEIVKKLMMLGIMANVNQVIDFDTAALIADEFGANVTKEVVVTIEERLFTEEEDKDEDMVERAPVVCVMGHVDHGKTSLLDAIRHTNVTAGEAGGITQAIGAYRVRLNDRDITFLDTPGHEAFTAMRARGAKSTDIAILVVAADDGIMPQTVEAINHAKAANIPIIVAINKMDKPHANADMVKQSLTAYDLVPEEWGGDTICVPVSALTKKGIPELLEMVLLVADMKELRANPNRRAKGLVLESRLDKGRGPVATLLVQNGTMHTGDVLIAGTSVGRVRAMMNDKGRTVKEAGPSVPVEITGLSEIPQAGDEFAVVEDERMARELAEQRRDQQKEEVFKANARANLDTLFAQIKEGVKDLNIIIKADVAGSAEAVKASLVKLSNDEVHVNVIHTAVGGITEGDVMLAAASNAIIIGFAVRPDKSALDSADAQGVEIRTYRIIYECIDEVEAAMKGMLAPTFREALLGHAEVRQTIRVPNVGTIAGSYILDGKVTRQSQIRVVRDGIVIFEDQISSLKRFKDDAKEVLQGFECGIGLERFNDIKEGDILEAFVMEEVKRD
ncbi:MAG: translation initiation factor IF-2 [Clostridia bacterium]|nr:translation initiation factor IF-2 [Clostridia bacterium]